MKGDLLPFRLTGGVRPALKVGVCGVMLWCAAGAAMAGEPAAAPAPAASAMAKAATWVQVEGAWIRPMVSGQTATGGYMSLTASQPLTLLGFKTKAAGTAELHEMKMAGDVMQMRAVPSLTLPAGQTVTMKPGPSGHHLMLMGVKTPLKAGDEVKLTLRLRKADGKTVAQDVVVPVRPQP